MDRRTMWQGLFKKRFRVVQDSMDALPGETTYEIPDKQFVILIKAPTPAGSLRAESVTDTDECLIVNRGQGKHAYVAWDQIDAISIAEL